MLKRFCFVFSMLAATTVGFAQHQVVEACSPPVGSFLLRGPIDLATIDRMRTLYDADQTARATDKVDWEVVIREDRARRVEVMGYLKKGKLTTGTGLYYASLIFQHGNCAKHYKLANRLAARALELDYDAGWLYAATLDRYLLSQGEKQKYGTQYIMDMDGCNYSLEPVDPKTTDAERARYDVPSLASAKATAAAYNANGCSNE